MTTGSLLTVLKHPPEAETLGLPTTTDGPEMVLGALEGPSVCQDARLPLPAPGLDGENSIVLCGYLPTWFGKCQLSPRWGHALTRTNTFLDIFPTSSSGMFLIPLFGMMKLCFLDFSKWGFPPLLWFVWFGLRGLGESSGSGPALRPCSMSLTQGQVHRCWLFASGPSSFESAVCSMGSWWKPSWW